MPDRPTSNAHGYRADILHFTAPRQAALIRDGLLVVGAGQILALGGFEEVIAQHPGLSVTPFPGKLIAPGFVDTHVHFPQIDVIGSPATGLLPWLENYTFPHEQRFADAAYAAQVAPAFVDELLRNGVTTPLVFCTSHPQSVDALMAEAAGRGMRLLAGKCLMDRHAPPGLTDDTEGGLRDSEALIQRWHGKGGGADGTAQGRLGYAITPRFSPGCTPRQLAGAGELARAHPGVWVQSHVAENHDEIRWALELFPTARSYLNTYDQFGLLRPRAVYAHCIHLDAEDRARMAATQTAAAVCPTSNLFLGSGLFDFAATDAAGMAWSLACDVGGGTSFSPFATMLAAYQVARLQGQGLAPQHLWWHHTGAGAAALGLDGNVGNLAPGLEADFCVIDPKATPLLARRTAAANSLDELLFALIVLGDDRAISGVGVNGVFRGVA
jgi:guanine deaminase